MSDSATPRTAASQASLSITISRSLLKFVSMESVMPSSHLILCGPLLLPPSIFPSIRVFSNESALHIRWPTYWSFSFSISPSNEYPGLISFRMDWFDLLAILGILKSPYPETNYSGKEYVKMCVCVCVAEARCHISVVKETVNRLYLNFFLFHFLTRSVLFFTMPILPRSH